MLHSKQKKQADAKIGGVVIMSAYATCKQPAFRAWEQNHPVAFPRPVHGLPQPTQHVVSVFCVACRSSQSQARLEGEPKAFVKARSVLVEMEGLVRDDLCPFHAGAMGENSTL